MTIDELLKQAAGIHLDIGCGAAKQPGFVGMDARALPGVDIVWNAEEFPWPLPPDCVTLAMASHLVEHIDPHGGVFVRFMDEVWRVCKEGAQFAIATPYATSPGYYQDPTHCNPCNEITWCYFSPVEQQGQGALWRIYKPKPWRIDSLTWNPVGNMEVVLRKLAMDEAWYA